MAVFQCRARSTCYRAARSTEKGGCSGPLLGKISRSENPGNIAIAYTIDRSGREKETIIMSFAGVGGIIIFFH